MHSWKSSGKKDGEWKESQNVKCEFAYVLTPDYYEVICIHKWHSNLCHAKLKRKSYHTAVVVARLPFSKIHNVHFMECNATKHDDIRTLWHHQHQHHGNRNIIMAWEMNCRRRRGYSPRNSVKWKQTDFTIINILRWFHCDITKP